MPAAKSSRYETRDRSSTRYALTVPEGGPAGKVALVPLPGGSGHANLDDKGCARALCGNSLIRFIPLFDAAGFATALVDAPADQQGADGLGGFRTAAAHAQDLGQVITDLRARTQAPVWIVGTSRGARSLPSTRRPASPARRRLTVWLSPPP